jgi:hypothetical protein
MTRRVLFTAAMRLWLMCRVFQLQPPTAERPYIPGLLDPCSNSKWTPNIPAETLYDAADDGLDPGNSWAGKWILLNPPFTARVRRLRSRGMLHTVERLLQAMGSYSSYAVQSVRART